MDKLDKLVGERDAEIWWKKNHAFADGKLPHIGHRGAESNDKMLFAEYDDIIQEGYTSEQLDEIANALERGLKGRVFVNINADGKDYDRGDRSICAFAARTAAEYTRSAETYELNQN